MRFMAIMVALVIGLFVLNGNTQEKKSVAKQSAENPADSGKKVNCDDPTPNVPCQELGDKKENSEAKITAPGPGCATCTNNMFGNKSLDLENEYKSRLQGGKNTNPGAASQNTATTKAKSEGGNQQGH